MFSQIVPQLRAKGWRALIPIYSGLKKPMFDGWQRFCVEPPSDADFALWFGKYRGCGIGLAYGPDGVVGIDLDWRDVQKAEEAWQLTLEIAGESPLIRVGRPPKRLVLFRRDPDLGSLGRAYGGFEIFAHSGQTLLFGRHPETRKPYYWLGETPATIGPHELPLLPQANLYALIDALAPLSPTATKKGRTGFAAPGALQGGLTSAFLRALRGAADTPSEAARLLATAPIGQRHHALVAAVFALVIKGHSDRVVYDAVADFYEVMQGCDMSAEQAEVEVNNAISWARQQHGPDDETIEKGIGPLFERISSDWLGRWGR